MLPKKYRFPRNQQLHSFLSFPHKYFLVKYELNHEGVPHIGFVVSKKIDKRATHRNRLKRKIRSYIEELDYIQLGGVTILFIINKNAVTASNSDLKTDMHITYTKLLLI